MTKVLLLIASAIFIKNFPVDATIVETSLVCEGSNDQVTCPYGTVIDVLSGFFGRRNPKICLKGGEEEVDSGDSDDTILLLQSESDEEMVSDEICFAPSSDVLTTLRETCQGRQFCIIRAESSEFGDPCPGTLKYLQMQYKCKPANTATVCQHQTEDISCPPGQTLNILAGFYGSDYSTTCGGKIWRYLCNLFVKGKCGRSIRRRCRAEGSLEKIQEICQGQQACTLEADNEMFGNPCRFTKKYIRATFSCIPEMEK